MGSLDVAGEVKGTATAYDDTFKSMWTGRGVQVFEEFLLSAISQSGTADWIFPLQP
jgi:hypothetical protein